MVVTKDLDIFLGNEGNTAMTLDASEIGGFNVGTYIEKIIEGQGSAVTLDLEQAHDLLWQVPGARHRGCPGESRMISHSWPETKSWSLYAMSCTPASRSAG